MDRLKIIGDDIELDGRLVARIVVPEGVLREDFLWALECIQDHKDEDGFEEWQDGRPKTHPEPKRRAKRARQLAPA